MDSLVSQNFESLELEVRTKDFEIVDDITNAVDCEPIERLESNLSHYLTLHTLLAGFVELFSECAGK